MLLRRRASEDVDFGNGGGSGGGANGDASGVVVEAIVIGLARGVRAPIPLLMAPFEMRVDSAGDEDR